MARWFIPNATIRKGVINGLLDVGRFDDDPTETRFFGDASGAADDAANPANDVILLGFEHLASKAFYTQAAAEAHVVKTQLATFFVKGSKGHTCAAEVTRVARVL